MKLKSLYALLICPVIIISSCLKTSSSINNSNVPTGGDTYFTITKDSTQVSYTTCLGSISTDQSDTSKTDLIIDGTNTAGSDVFAINIQVSGHTFNTGNYYTVGTRPSYINILETIFTPGAETFQLGLKPPADTAASNYTVNISAITSASITGTFTGDFLVAGDSIIHVTQGQFLVYRTQ
jgi:hypothetical protein